MQHLEKDQLRIPLPPPLSHAEILFCAELPAPPSRLSDEIVAAIGTALYLTLEGDNQKRFQKDGTWSQVGRKEASERWAK